MGRPEAAITRDGSPQKEIAFWLRDLRNQSGLTYEQLSHRAKYSISTLQEAASGRRLPTLNVTIAIVNACDGDEQAWRSYWAQLKRAVDREPSSAVSESVVPPWAPRTEEDAVRAEPDVPQSAIATAADPADIPSHLRWWRRRRWQLVAGSMGALLVATSAFVLLANSPSKPPPAFVSITAQNKSASGPSLLLEYTDPVSLSSEAIAFCSKRGCQLPGTGVWSGAKLVASCWTHGEEMTNADTTSAGILQNPNAYSSNLWYKTLWSDGRYGYISEVYIAPADRGGRGLAECKG